MGPVQVLVVAFAHPRFTGEVLSEIARLRDAHIVGLVDVLLVERREDGSFETLPAPVDSGDASGSLAAAILGHADDGVGTRAHQVTGDSDGASFWSLADVVPPGSVAAVALIEHTWATPLRSAVKRAGGTLVEETWLAADDLALLDDLVAKRSG